MKQFGSEESSVAGSPAQAQPAQTAELDVMLSAFRLARALKRCPPDRGRRPFPPAVGRLLDGVRQCPGISSRDLSNLLEVRPSSLSEMLSRAEEDGLVLRTPDEGDRRIQHIWLTERGNALAAGTDPAGIADAVRKTACFSEAEKRLFAALCRRFVDHLESLSLDLPCASPLPSDPLPDEGCPPPEGSQEGVNPDASGPERMPPGARIRC